MNIRASIENVSLLRSAYNSLLHAQSSALDAILDDGRDSDSPYPVYAPTICDLSSGQHGFNERIALANSIKNVFTTRKEDLSVTSGLVCASPSTVQKITELNDAKTALKTVIAAIKAQDSDDPESVISQRGSQLRLAMKEVGFAAVDLKRVYAQVRVLEPDLHRVSWTWARNHKTHKRITRIEMQRRIDQLRETSPAAAIELENAVAKVGSAKFTEKFSLPPQLRANCSYGAKGKLTLRSYPVSGVLIAQQKTLPRVQWRDLDDIADREARKPPKANTYKLLLEGWGIYYDASNAA